MLDKGRVIDAFIEHLESRLAQMRSSIESTRRQARDAPGANVSHSDTSKFALSNVALGLSGEVLVISEAIASMRQLRRDSLSCGGPGALVALRGGNDEESRCYLLVLKGGGEILRIGDVEITTLSVGAPLGRACMRKEAEEEFTVNGKSYAIASIW